MSTLRASRLIQNKTSVCRNSAFEVPESRKDTMTNQLNSLWTMISFISITGAALAGPMEPAAAQESRDTYLGFRLVGNVRSEVDEHRLNIRTLLFPVGMTILNSGHVETISPMTLGYAWNDTRTIPYLFTSTGTTWLHGT